MVARLPLMLLLLAPLLGCDDLGDFKTQPQDVFHGVVTGSDSELDEASFIRQGFDSFTELDLTFDPELASTYQVRDAGLESGFHPPGSLTTYVCPEQSYFCDPGERTVGRFHNTPLETFSNLSHDSLSRYDFPGGGRVRNYIFGARFDSSGEGLLVQRHAMVFLSLMETGRVEVRIIAPSVVDAGGRMVEDSLFGVFSLRRREAK